MRENPIIIAVKHFVLNARGFISYNVIRPNIRIQLHKHDMIADSCLPFLWYNNYAIIIFVMIGVYPKVFPLFEKIGKKEEV